ncbi:MAG TPA: UDP-N-acetylglucosamine 2-epimerase [Phycisphaerales bacterium]|nr:UDP-N-acetylglucosamine 2-epimerase [Phycisphaerales bacterium]
MSKGPGGPELVAVVTGSRAEFGLLAPVMEAIDGHRGLRLAVVAGGAHLLAPGLTINEVRARWPVAAEVQMQEPGAVPSREGDAAAVGRGIMGFARVFAALRPGWVLVLGDRVEAFAAAAAGSIAGLAVAHVHAGDRAEGIADEAMRHAITKLAHLHLAATEESRRRVLGLGERPEHALNVGSPAIDGLVGIGALSEAEAGELGDPRVVVLLHPSGLPAERERRLAEAVLAAGRAATPRMLVLAPNHDPGSEVIREVISAGAGVAGGPSCVREHLPRGVFLGLLGRLSRKGGVLLGNSSAGLIEAAALGLPCINVGPRQGGRERAGNVIDVPERELGSLAGRVAEALALPRPRAVTHPYGDGRAGVRIADALAERDPRDPALLRKRNGF